MNLNYDLQKIEAVLAEKVKEKELSKYVFKGQRPSKVDTSMSDFIVVSVPSVLSDMNAYGRCTSRIEIFVKNLSDGTKNSTMLSLKFEKLNQLFPIENDTYLFDIYPTIIPLGNDKEGYNVIAININTLIKTI